jgi:hypothetical protein
MGTFKRLSGYATPGGHTSTHIQPRVRLQVCTLWMAARAKGVPIVDLASGLSASFMGVVSLCSPHTRAESMLRRVMAREL